VTDTSARDPARRPIGILGGSFNPPHLGHTALARDALVELGLERVVLMPVNTPHGKPLQEDPGPQHRLAMCRLATAHEPGLSACSLEIDRGGASYTADTLTEIHAQHPEVELTFIVGADTARTLTSWSRPEVVLASAALAIAGRPGTSEQEVLAALAQVEIDAHGEEPACISFLAMKPVDVSSSLARARIAAGESVQGLLHPDVSHYVAEHGLYGARVAA
jgi:nicotinate-nucleotide adenylyltransferase